MTPRLLPSRLLSSPFDVLQGFPGSIGPPGENGPEGIKVRGAAEEWLWGWFGSGPKKRGKGNGKGRDGENPGDLRAAFWLGFQVSFGC